MNVHVAALFLLLAPLGAASAQDWQSLFDGKTLSGWKAGDNATSWKVVDGAIAGHGERSHLFYVGEDGKASFKNFELSVEARTLEGANSGVYFHTACQENGWPGKGFEVQVLNKRPTQGDYRENKLTGSLYGIRNVYKAMARDGEWFTMRVLVQGKRVRVLVNDVLVVDYTEPAPAPGAQPAKRRIDEGTFALQCHDPSSRVFFKNLRVKRLPDNSPDNAPAGPPASDYEKEVRKLGAANYPVVNYHVHLKGGLTLEEALAESRKTGIFYGIAVNCGLNFSVTNDAGIDAYLATMKGQPAFVAMQAEGREWVHLFSRQAISRFDYVFTDSMTIVDDSGRRMRLWIPAEVPEIKDKEAFMDMLVDRTVKILSNEPINIYVNPTYLPDQIAADYDRLWTPERMKKVIDAAVAHNVAIEINARRNIPREPFLRAAKAAGCKFTFGTNNGDREVGKLDYCFQMVEKLGLRWQDIWTPPAH